MWPPFLFKSRSPEDHETRIAAVEKRVTQHDVWIRDHEDDIRGKLLRIETDINMLASGMNEIRLELELERKERFATIMDAFAEKAEEIITRVLSTTRSEFGIGRAEMADLKSRVRNLEVRGEDDK